MALQISAGPALSSIRDVLEAVTSPAALRTTVRMLAAAVVGLGVLTTAVPAVAGEQTASAQACDQECKDDALAGAIAADKYDWVEGWLRAGADPNGKAYGRSPIIHLAARRCDPKVAQILTEAGANPNAKNEDGETAIQHAEGETVHPESSPPRQARCKEVAEILRGALRR